MISSCCCIEILIKNEIKYHRELNRCNICLIFIAISRKEKKSLMRMTLQNNLTGETLAIYSNVSFHFILIDVDKLQYFTSNISMKDLRPNESLFENLFISIKFVHKFEIGRSCTTIDLFATNIKFCITSDTIICTKMNTNNRIFISIHRCFTGI